MKNECREYAQHIADELKALYDMENDEREKLEEDGETSDIYGYIADALDVEYTLDSNRELIGVRLYVTLGGRRHGLTRETERPCVHGAATKKARGSRLKSVMKSMRIFRIFSADCISLCRQLKQIDGMHGYNPEKIEKEKEDKTMKIICGNIEFATNQQQEKELEYLARWHADLQYIRERFGKDDPECEVSRKSIEFAFRQLDALAVPFWLQNAALSFSEDWRRYKSMSFWQYIANKPGYAIV